MTQYASTLLKDLEATGRSDGTSAGTALKLDSYGSPEAALLLAASGGDPSRESVRRLMAGRLDWAQLTRLAVESHATPGLWEVVSAFPDLPGEATVLQARAVYDDFRRYHIRAMVAKVVKELRQAGIECLALKGAAILAGGVQRPTARTMSDIDLLVVEGSPEAAWRLCRSNGWSLVDEGWTEDLYRDHHHLAPLIDPDGISIGLELHRTLLTGIDRLGIDMSALLARSRMVDVGGVAVRVPSVEDLLLHACLHFAWSNKMRRGAWRAYADAHAILSDPGFSWDRFAAVATSRRAKQCCYWTMRIGRAVADLHVPDGMLERFDPSSGGPLGRLLERHFATQVVEANADSAVSERARRWLWFAAMHESSRSAEASDLWNEGAVDLPGEGNTVSRPPRGALSAALSTVAYLARLATRV